MGLPRLVDPARDHRDRLLVQRRAVAEHVAGVLDAVVVPGPVRLAVPRSRRSARRSSRALRLSILTMILAVPLGTVFAIGLDRWHGRPAAGATSSCSSRSSCPRSSWASRCSCSFSYLLKSFVPSSGPTAQVLGLVTFQLSYPVIIVRARLLTIGRSTRKRRWTSARTPSQAIRRVLLPLLSPAIFASVALVFADTIDDFVTVRYLSRRGGHRAPVGEDLLGRPRRTDAGGERRRHVHAGLHAAR